MSLVLAHKTNSPANAMVIFSLLENGGFHPMFQNYHHGYIAIGYLGALGGINIMLPEQEVDDAKSFVSSVKEIEDFDPLPDPLVRDIVQASIITVNPFFFVYHLSPIIQFIAFWMLVGFEVLFFSMAFSMAIITNLVSIFYILMIAHAKYIAVPKVKTADEGNNMTLHGQYDTDNIFAKIMRREMPCVKVYEDANILAILDAFPQSDGHVLVMPKAPSRNLLETHAKDIGRLFGTTQRIAAAVKTALKPDGIRIMQFNGAPAGQTVFHTHVHIVPCYDGKDPSEHGSAHAGGEMADATHLQSIADKIKSAL